MHTYVCNYRKYCFHLSPFLWYLSMQEIVFEVNEHCLAGFGGQTVKDNSKRFLLAKVEMNVLTINQVQPSR